MPLEPRAKLAIVARDRRGSRHDDAVHRRQLVLMQAEGLADQTLETIALHRVPRGLARDGETQPWILTGIFACKHRESAIDRTHGRFEYPRKLAGPRQPLSSGECRTIRCSSGRGATDNAWQELQALDSARNPKIAWSDCRVEKAMKGFFNTLLGTKAGTAFRAPPVQDLTPVLGGHAGTKTVGPLPMQIAGLIGAFHGSQRPQRKPATLRMALSSVNRNAPGGRPVELVDNSKGEV